MVEFKKAAAESIVQAAKAMEIAEAAAQQAGLTTKSGKISKFRAARAALRPTSTARDLLAGAAAEIERRREDPPSGDSVA